MKDRTIGIILFGFLVGFLGLTILMVWINDTPRTRAYAVYGSGIAIGVPGVAFSVLAILRFINQRDQIKRAFARGLIQQYNQTNSTEESAPVAGDVREVETTPSEHAMTLRQRRAARESDSAEKSEKPKKGRKRKKNKEN